MDKEWRFITLNRIINLADSDVEGEKRLRQPPVLIWLISFFLIKKKEKNPFFLMQTGLKKSFNSFFLIMQEITWN